MPRMTIVVNEQDLESRRFQCRLIIRVELVSIHHNPIGALLTRDRNYFRCILGCAGSLRQLPDLAMLRFKSRADGWRVLGHGKARAAACIVPSLCQRQTSHDVADPHADTGVSADQKIHRTRNTGWVIGPSRKRTGSESLSQAASVFRTSA